MTQDLQQKPQAGQQPVALQAFSGAILGLQGDVLQGWAIDTAQPEQRPVVEIFIDGAGIALARADQYEPQAPQGDQFHGFAVQLRESWLAEAQVITARIANQPFTLDGTVVLPTSPSKQAPAFASQVWHTGGLRVAGWSWDPQSPNRHVQITVREGDQIIGHATCNTHHQALAYRATSDHGFTLDLPWELADGNVHVLDVIDDHNQPLAGSPIRVCCWPEGVEALVRQLPIPNDSPKAELLKKVMGDLTALLPKSAGWNHYSHWYDTYQRLDHIERPPLRKKVGLLLISHGERTLEESSFASLGEDLEHLHLIATSSPSDVLPSLSKLLSGGCDQILPLLAGDRLAPLALPYLSASLADGGAWAFADCDRDGPQGERSLPWLKPVWDIDLFIAADIFSPGAIFSSEIIKTAEKTLSNSNKKTNLSWHKFLAGIAAATHLTKSKVVHLPRILYHRANYNPASPEQGEVSLERLSAMQWLSEQIAPGSAVSPIPDYPALLRAVWPLPDVAPKVSLIVPTRDQLHLLKTCVEGLINDTDYPNLEIIVVDNQSESTDTLNYLIELRERGVVVIPHPHPFNYSTINNRAAKVASGEIIGLINNDIEVIDGGWLRELISQLLRPNIGAVGAKLLWPNGMVQHGGVVVGINRLAAHSGNTLAHTDAGYMALNQLTRRQSAVTAACLVLRKETFENLGGLSEKEFPVAFNDVDLCMRIMKSGLDILWSANAVLTHAESASRGKDVTPEKRQRALREQEIFSSTWCPAEYGDPHYHPALSSDYLSGPYGGLALPLPPNAFTPRTKSTPLSSSLHKQIQVK